MARNPKNLRMETSSGQEVNRGLHIGYSGEIAKVHLLL